jgi:tRNA threonylcarbamoyladenosine biosynthesis protein TsaE
MSENIVKEGDWENFVQKKILPLITRSRNKSGMTNTSSGMTNTSQGMMGATIFALVGDLGAGKTTFSKILLKELGVKEHVQSPTFSIINSYDIMRPQDELGVTGESFEKVFHIDVYRIEDIKELEVLHMDEIINNKNNIVIIEWADKMKKNIPQDAVWIYFEHDTLETRKVILDSRLRGNDDIGDKNDETHNE